MVTPPHMGAVQEAGMSECSADHVCANHPIHAQAKIIKQRMDLDAAHARVEALEQEVAALRPALEQARVQMAMLRNVIQCAEPWTDLDESSYQITRTQVLAALQAASPRAGDGGAEGVGG